MSNVFMMISGGIDSMVLAQYYVNNGIEFKAIYIDDSEYSKGVYSKNVVELFCQKNNIKLYQKKYVKNKNGNNNLEANMRDFRYNFAFEVMAGFENPILITAHHLNDRVETMLMNFVRGSGVLGLSNMNEIESKNKGFNYQHHRPFINKSKNEIKLMANEFGFIESVNYAEDLSNDDTDITRNWFRHNVVNKIMNEFSHKGISRSFELLSQESVDLNNLKINLEDGYICSDFIDMNCINKSQAYYLAKKFFEKSGITFTKKGAELFAGLIFNGKEFSLRSKNGDIQFGFTIISNEESNDDFESNKLIKVFAINKNEKQKCKQEFDQYTEYLYVSPKLRFYNINIY